jgi:DNA-binding SARP family transcriptional activator
MTVALFGSFNLQVSGHRIGVSSRLASILALLARRLDSGVRRDHLAEIYWGDLPEQQARRNLRVALCRINCLMRGWMPNNGKFIHASANLVWLPSYPFVQIDANEFETVVESCCLSQPIRSAETTATLRRGIQLYRHDLLCGMDDGWIVAERESLRSKFLLSLRCLAITALEQNDLHGALSWCERSLSEDVGNEPAALLAMKIAANLGNRARAVSIFRTLQLALRREYSLSPSPEVINLLQELTTDPPKPASFEIDLDRMRRTMLGHLV